jgi:hypothetical protein
LKKEKSILTFMEELKTPNSKSHPEQKEQYWDITKQSFKLYYRTTVTKTTWYWEKTNMKTNGTE